ncbi:MAG: ATP-binding protein [Actinomycetota bacterium]
MIATPSSHRDTEVGVVVVDATERELAERELALVNEAAAHLLALPEPATPADFFAALDRLAAGRADGDPGPVSSFAALDLGDGEGHWHWNGDGDGDPADLHVVTVALDGQPHRRLWVLHDTSRLHDAAHQARRAMNAMLDADILVEAVRDPAGEIVDFRFVEVNDAAMRFIASYPPAVLHHDRTPDEQRHDLLAFDLVESSQLGIGRSLRDSGLFALFVETLERGEPFTTEHTPSPNPPGSTPRRLDLRINPVGDTLSITWRDITEAHQQRETIRALQQQLDRMLTEGPVLGVHFRRGGAITWASGSTTRILGRTPAELIGADATVIIHPDDLEHLVSAVEHLRAGGATVPLEFRVRRPDGSVRYLQGQFFLLDDGSEDFEAVFADITERVEADRLRATVTAVASHEIRSPLAFLQTSLHLLGDGTVDPGSEQGHALIARMTRVGTRLTGMTNRLLDLQHLEFIPAPVVDDAVPVGAVVGDAAECVLPGRGVTVVLDDRSDGAARLVDGELLSLAVTNLVENAARHAPDRSEVLVTTAVGPGSVRVTVRDHGPGVPADQRDRIFDAFEQARPEDRHHGAGLGLAVVRRVAERHGGSAWSGSPTWAPAPSSCSRSVRSGV